MRRQRLSLLLLFPTLAACGHAGAPSVADPTGVSRRHPASLHAHQRDWPAHCHDGALQSPIAISSADFGADAPSPLTASLGASTVALLDVGHTVQIRVFESRDTVDFEGVRYALRQVHFHKAAEHLLDGRQAEMELHAVFVASAAEGAPRVLVLGFLIEEGSESAALAPLWAALDDREGYGEDMTEPMIWQHAMETRELETSTLTHGEVVVVAHAPFDLGALLPGHAHFYVYEGSLTTPDCAEGITHAVASTPLTMSHDQIERFEGYYEGNNRDIQPAGDAAARARRRAVLVR